MFCSTKKAYVSEYASRIYFSHFYCQKVVHTARTIRNSRLLFSWTSHLGGVHVSKTWLCQIQVAENLVKFNFKLILNMVVKGDFLPMKKSPKFRTWICKSKFAQHDFCRVKSRSVSVFFCPTKIWLRKHSVMAIWNPVVEILWWRFRFSSRNLHVLPLESQNVSNAGPL